MKHKLMSIHLAYFILFSYFCVVCENNEFCFYIFFSHNSFDFPREDCSMYESYTIHKPQNAIYEKPVKTVYTRLLFHIIAVCDNTKLCATR